MKIADIDLGSRPVLLAPMEDVTDLSFRMICREMGAAMVYTEFVSAEALIRDISSTVRKLTINDRERPVAIQIYGRDPEAMVSAARIVEKAEPDILDINFGCPVKKVASKGAGAGMLRDIPKMLDITKRIVEAVSIPVTVKTRLGWDCENKIITDLGPRLQDCGIKALTVHGRTRSQMYTGKADWTLIKALRDDPRMEIPIIGNGDITTPDEALAAFETFGVDGVMVGRASFGAPWIFKEMRHFIDTGQYVSIDIEEKFNLLNRQINESIERIDEYRGILHIRRHLASSPLFKNIPNFRETRIKMLRADSLAELQDVLENAKSIIKNLK
ncbi:MAG: tRNA dihydrouridine synthase DusB [Bacteroidales bacterium]|nr:tRNA dihydrouridine synthase DusB [Bacteroidales bacterium]MBD5205461.1 tRNA dihydrouridine synthase DusB [Bacteroidales bacterium]MBD5224242.1 tRNA dihydrouridine synthase DusB [Bacteroidales bacterium]MBD5302722.1 tRNA dihydrouridine synthase DusB [Bacteroides sp.]